MKINETKSSHQDVMYVVENIIIQCLLREHHVLAKTKLSHAVRYLLLIKLLYKHLCFVALFLNYDYAGKYVRPMGKVIRTTFLGSVMFYTRN